MIRGIVAIDNKRGMADDHGIPWGIPGDRAYYVSKLQTGLVLMGYGTYVEIKHAYGSHDNFVATTHHDNLREGFTPIADPRQFLTSATDDVWNIGGANLLADTMDLLDELYITQLQADFHTTKFLPDYHQDFTLAQESAPQQENNITYTFQIWTKLTKKYDR
jgi:dihydrofolate reductase